MRDRTTLVAVKLTATELRAVDALVSEGRFKTRSALMRAAVMQILEREGIDLATLADIRIERVYHPMRRSKKDSDAEPAADDPPA